jgi:hypothetical protein
MNSYPGRACTRQVADAKHVRGKFLAYLSVLLLAWAGGSAEAQEIRYSWLDMSYMGQDVGRAGSLTPLPGQTVDVAVSDGAGVRFRGSLGTWKNFYLMLDYGSTDIDLTGRVTNTGTGFVQDFVDEFDYTTTRGGVGVRLPLRYDTDIFGELTYDSLNFDFGSFAGENFDMERQEVGGALGVRTMFGDHLQAQLRVRYSALGDADLTTGLFDTDTLVGLGFAWELIRGLSVVGDYESGEFSNWSIGFRLDLSED